MIPTNADRADFTAPPTAAQIERQIRWEAASIEAGIKLCREEPANPALTLAVAIEQELTQRICADGS
jgi:hypothetical protein